MPSLLARRLAWGRTTWAALATAIPRGKTLPYDVWERRQRGITLLLWLHLPAIFLYAVHQGVGVMHGGLEAALIAVFAWAASALRKVDRRWSTVAAALGLLTCSAVLVHLSHGLIEMHFHFFVVIGIVTLYQDWEPFLIAIAYVVLEHGVGGALIPGSVYSHPEAVEDPWTWAAVHGAFILGMSAAGIASWRLNESLLSAASSREAALADAQQVARIGSFDWDVRTGVVRFSDQLRALLDLDPSTELTTQTYMERIHPDDADRVRAEVGRTLNEGVDSSVDCRVVLGDTVRWTQLRCHASERAATGEALAVSGTAQDITERINTNSELRSTLSLLSATLDSTADGILVVDVEGRISMTNQRFADMWRLPADLVAEGDDDKALAVAMQQLVDPDGFLARVRALYDDPDAESLDIVEFLDGRVFERSSTPQRVGGEVVGRVWTFRDITEHKRLQAELSHQAFHDSLTGLANQALFRDRVEHAVARSNRQGDRIAVLFVDLDNFKTVNDSLGHTVGDELLVAVTERLQGCVREGDTTARMGGDEFAILLEETDAPREAVMVAERIIDALRRPVVVGDQDLYITASVGIAFDLPTAGVDQLMRNADLAMYTAKRRGRGRFEVYAPDMHAAAIERLELEADLRRALQREELLVEYQPVFSLLDGSMRAFEALVRWQHPTRGLLLPGAFVPLAEETGVICEIGRFVLLESCRQAVEWRATAGDLAVTVNLSPRQLLDEDVTDLVAGVLEATGLEPQALILELTEGAMMHDAAIDRLHALKALGVGLAIDDFGTGYSSLSYLQRLPVDVVKIDRSFVEQLSVDNPEASVAAAIVQLASALHLETIAEGVETAEQAALLRRVGCELAQGFHLARPSGPEMITEHLRRSHQREAV